MSNSSQNESALTIVGSVVCGVLITLLVLNWLSRKNKDMVQSMFYEKQVVEQQVSNTRTSEKTMTQSEVMALIKMERLQMENESLKKENQNLTASLKSLTDKQLNSVPSYYQSYRNENDVKDLKNNVSKIEEKLVDKIESLQEALRNQKHSTVAVADPRIDLLIQEVRSLNQQISLIKNQQQSQASVYVSPAAPVQQHVAPIVRQPQPVSPTTNQENIQATQQPTINVQSQRPVVKPLVRQQANALDIRTDLGPDPQDVKPRYKNDELK